MKNPFKFKSFCILSFQKQINYFSHFPTTQQNYPLKEKKRHIANYTSVSFLNDYKEEKLMETDVSCNESKSTSHIS